MSSTNRGSVRPEHDVYPTPGWCVRRLLERVSLPSGLWFEPCAGEGAIIDAANEWIASDAISEVPGSLIRWESMDIRPECYEPLRVFGRSHCGDFLKFTPVPRCEVVITNPPFSIAQQVIEQSLQIADVVVMLLRLNWLGTEVRHPFVSEFMPDVHVLPNRPKFDLMKRGTDSIEYAWFVWRRTGRLGARRTRGLIEMLALTPRGERKRDRERSFDVLRPAGTLCPKCSEPQLATPLGLTCRNAHGGADPLEEDEAKHG